MNVSVIKILMNALLCWSVVCWIKNLPDTCKFTENFWPWEAREQISDAWWRNAFSFSFLLLSPQCHIQTLHNPLGTSKELPIGMSPNPEFPLNHVADIVPENPLPSKQPPCPPATWALANTYLTLHCMWKKAHCVPVMNTWAGVCLHVVGGKAFPRAFSVLPIRCIMKHFYIVLWRCRQYLCAVWALDVPLSAWLQGTVRELNCIGCTLITTTTSSQQMLPKL